MPFSSLALGLSYAWEVFCLPIHARRLAVIRRASHQVRYQNALSADEELALFRHSLTVIKRMEREMEQLDFRLASSRRLAVHVFAATVARLEHKFSANLHAPAHSPEAV